MAKSKRTSVATVDKTTNNVIAKQFQSVRAEIRKVTWPTQEEARSLTLAVTVLTIVMALFLFIVDLVFEGVIFSGVVGSNVAWMITGVVVLVLLGLAFFSNSKDY